MGRFWHKFSRSQQNQLLILFCALMLAGYALWYVKVYKEINFNERMISRREDRMAKHAAPVPEPKGKVVTDRQLKEAETKKAEEERNLRRLLQRFVALDDVQARQVLQRELSELSSGLGMRVIKLEGALRRSVRENEVPDFEKVPDADVRYGRPLIIFEAWGSYFALQTMLDELDSLSYLVSPVNIRITADEPRMTARQAVETQQLLRIEMVLAI